MDFPDSSVTDFTTGEVLELVNGLFDFRLLFRGPCRSLTLELIEALHPLLLVVPGESDVAPLPVDIVPGPWQDDVNPFRGDVSATGVIGELKDGGVHVAQNLIKALAPRHVETESQDSRVLGHLLPKNTLKRPLVRYGPAESLDHGKAGVARNDEVRSGRIWQWDPFECRREDLIEELARFRKECMGKASACAHQMSPVTNVVGF